MAGSRSYLAPEIFTKQGYRGPSADIWSSGVCLFAMLSGFFPFDEASARDWRFKKAKHAYGLGHSLTRTIYAFYNKPCVLADDTVELLDGMLAIDPAKRLSMTEIFKSDFMQPAMDLVRTDPQIAYLTQQDSTASCANSSTHSNDTYRSLSSAENDMETLQSYALKGTSNELAGHDSHRTKHVEQPYSQLAEMKLEEKTDIVTSKADASKDAGSYVPSKNCGDMPIDLLDCIKMDDHKGKFRDSPMDFLTNAMTYFGMDPWETPLYRGGGAFADTSGTLHNDFEDRLHEDFVDEFHANAPSDTLSTQLLPPLPTRQLAFFNNDYRF